MTVKKFKETLNDEGISFENDEKQEIKKSKIKWSYANYGNSKAEIQDEAGLVAVVRTPSLAKEICERHNKTNETEPNLGCATTRELLVEIKARIEVLGELDYKTIETGRPYERKV